jgi:hypothetical protein
MAALMVGFALIAGGERGSAATTSWTFKGDEGVRIPSGVSTEVVRLANGTQLAYVGTPSGLVAYRSTDASHYTYAQVNAQLPAGGDPAIVPISGDGLRMYYVASTGSSSASEIDSAVSTDGLNWTVESGTRLMIDTPPSAVALEAVVLPTGAVRLYYVAAPVMGPGTESIDSATSSDGLRFAADSGHRLTGGYIDPAVLRLRDGSWLMVVSRAPSEQQRLFLVHSSDGSSWTVDSTPVLDPAEGANALDPTLLLGPFGYGGGGTQFIAVYYSSAAAGEQSTGPYTVLSGSLAGPLGTTMRWRCNDVLGRLTVAVTGNGTVTGSVVGPCPGERRSISCSRVCAALSPHGEDVKLTARPTEGYELSRWSGACFGKNLTCRFSLHGHVTVRATFVKS